MKTRLFAHILGLFTFLFVLMSCEETESIPDGYSGATLVDTLEIGDAIRFPDTLIAYVPAPGQFINVSPGLPANAQSIIGGQGFVTLGGWGGYIVVGFHDPIINHPDNAYGVDFSIFGNAYDGSAEPGIVMVMKDENKNKLADDTWYELQGAEHQEASTIKNYSVTYYHTNDSVVIWKDNQGQTDTLLRNGFHQQSYYPSSENYPQINPDSITFVGTKLKSKSTENSPGHWVNPNFGYGYADNHTVNYSAALNDPDDPSTADILEGCGGDAFDLEWAIDAQGHHVTIDTVHFIKIYNGVFDANAMIGDVSTEIKAIVPVR